MTISQLFSVSFVDSEGVLCLERINGISEIEITQNLQSLGKTVVRCQLVKSFHQQQLRNNFLGSFTKSKGIDTITFSQDMATLLDAGVTVKNAVLALTRRENSPSNVEVFRKISSAIETGHSFSNALAQAGAFPDLLVATVGASEETGDLATGLSRYAKHQYKLRLVRDKIVGAAVYPTLLLGVGILVVALLLGVVVPRFATIIDSTGKELPFLSKVLLSWGQFVDANPWIPLFLLVLTFTGFAFSYSFLKNAQARKNFLSKIPGVAKVVREFQHLQMYRTTAILTSRGIAIHKALVYSEEFLDPIDQLHLHQALADIKNGQRISDSLSASGLADDVATSMISVAESTGSMPEMLDRIADFYERSLQRNMDIVSRLIEPVLMIIFGALIGGIVVLMYLPIFDLASSVS